MASHRLALPRLASHRLAPPRLARPRAPFTGLSALTMSIGRRTSLMNCTMAISSSLLMDYAPKEQRARWQSFGSVVRFGWCGSAALGGVLADQHGYSFTFIITAAIQLAGTLVQASLLGVVPRAEKVSPPAAAAAPAAEVPPADPGLDVAVEPRLRGSIQALPNGPERRHARAGG
jgi:MFS family permease